MSVLGEMLFPPADYRRTTLSMLGWWESRRLQYNLVVGAAGLFTLAFLRIISLTPPGLPMMFDWRPVAAYALAANVCYTFGWCLESLIQRLLGAKAPTLGPVLFRQGLAFSVGLTLLPTLLASAAWVIRLVYVIVH